MSPDPPDESEERLLAMLADALAHDEPPEDAVRFAQESHRLIEFESELAEIFTDSLVDTTGMRGMSDGLRTIRFRADGAELVVEVERSSVTLSVTPTQRRIDLITAGGTTTLEVDETGMATFDAPSGPCRFALESLTSVRIVTEWVFLSRS